ncbi:MAG: glycosyltransferase family 9 protein [Holosporales bacterium]|nr:glycosyltransferase family 9 protein [Holosporales bacterium]
MSGNGRRVSQAQQRDCQFLTHKIPTPKAGDRVLWIRFLAFGDALESAADICNFKRYFPDVHMTFLSNPEYVALLQAQPYIDEALGGRKKPRREWMQTLRKIRAGNYKWVVNAHRRGWSSLLVDFSGASYCIGPSSLFPFNCHCHLDLQSWLSPHELDIQDRSRPSIFAATEDLENALTLLKDLPERRLFALIGAGNADKMWRTEGWIALLRTVVEGGWGVVLNGHGPIEAAVGRQIEEALASSCVLNLVGTLDFKKMSGVASACTLALGHDTGPMHLAALSGVPTMGLFNCSTSRSIGLRMPWFRELCAEDWCFKNNVPKRNLPLKALPPEPVLKAFDAFAEEFVPSAFLWRSNA